MHIEESDPAVETVLQRSSKIKATWPPLQGHDGELVEGLCFHTLDLSGVLSSVNVRLLGHFFPIN